MKNNNDDIEVNIKSCSELCNCIFEGSDFVGIKGGRDIAERM